MRRPVIVAALVGLLLVACTDQPTEVPSQPESPLSPELDVGTHPCSLNDLVDAAALLFPASPARTAIVNSLKALSVVRQTRLANLIKAAAFGIVDIVGKAYTAGKLVNSPDTPRNVLNFITVLYCFTGVLPAPNFPSGPIDPSEFAVAVVTPNSGPVLVRPPSKHGALSIQAQSVPQTTTVTVIKLANTPGPLLTSLDQFPLFYEFRSSPEVTFSKLVTAGVCLADNFPRSDFLVLAHNVGTNFGDVEILPPAVAPVVCTGLPVVVGSAGGLRGFMDGGLASLRTALLPSELHAASAQVSATKAVGGTLKHLSPFGSVDTASNPGSLSIVNQTGSPISGTVSGPGPVFTVFVKATSQDGAPINSVPVSFGGTTRVTGADGNGAGIASFLWTATPGTSLVATVLPNQETTGGEGGTCPSHPAPGVDGNYRPSVCFSPTSLTFTRPGFAYRFVGTQTSPGGVIAVAPGDTAGWTTPGFGNFGSWQTSSLSPLPFGDADTYGESCGYVGEPPTLPVTTPWLPSTRVPAEYQATDVAASAASGLLLRQYVTVPNGATSLTIHVAVDNDIAVFLNGQPLAEGTGVTFTRNSGWDPGATNGFFTHGGCATQDSGALTVDATTGLFTAGQPNLVAVYGRDRGGATYLNVTFSTLPSF